MLSVLNEQAKPILNEGDVKQVIDPRIGEDYDVAQLSRLAFAASLCIRASPIWRPTMGEVIIFLVQFKFQLSAMSKTNDYTHEILVSCYCC